MTQTAIQKQLDAIKTVTEKALKSKEASRQILISAGFIKEKKIQPPLLEIEKNDNHWLIINLFKLQDFIVVIEMWGWRC